MLPNCICVLSLLSKIHQISNKTAIVILYRYGELPGKPDACGKCGAFPQISHHSKKDTLSP